MSATEPEALVLRDALFDDPEARSLIDELQQEYVVRYGGRDETPVNPREFDPPAGAFLIAEIDGVPGGCAGLRRHDEEAAELKRMFVRRPFRRRGLALTLLSAMETRARLLGYQRVILETGTKQPEALQLYITNGYQPYEKFGHYAHSGLSQTFAKTLVVPKP